MDAELPNVRVKRDFEYVGTKHTITMLISGHPQKCTYKVYDISGLAKFAPEKDDPVVYLELVGRVGFPAPPFVVVTLPMFADRFYPVGKEDMFWEFKSFSA